MKKNRLFVYIVMFFAIFLFGKINVNAEDKAQYLVCYYELSKEDANKANSQLNFVHNEFAYVVYIDGVFRGAATGEPKNNSSKDSGGGYPANYYNTISKGQYGKLLSLSTPCNKTTGYCYTKCPTVQFTGYKKKNVKDVDLYKDKKPIDPTNSKTIYNKALGDISCEYKYDGKSDGQVTTKILYASSWKNNNLITKKGNLIDSIGIISSNDGTETKMGYVISDLKENASTMHRVLSFLATTDGKCPLYLNGDPKTSPRYSNVVIGHSTYVVRKYSACDYKNDKSYKELKEWIDKNYDATTQKTTATVNKKFGEELNANKEKFETLWNKMNQANRNNCLADIKISIDKMYEQCNSNENCKTKETEKNAEELSRMSFSDLNILEDITNLYNTDVGECKDYFGDPDDPDSFISILQKILLWIRIAAPTLVIVLGLFDFSQVIISSDPDALKKSTAKFSKRLIAAIILFFIPLFISILMDWMNTYIMQTNGNCVSLIEYVLNNFRR